MLIQILRDVLYLQIPQTRPFHNFTFEDHWPEFIQAEINFKDKIFVACMLSAKATNIFTSLKICTNTVYINNMSIQTIFLCIIIIIVVSSNSKYYNNVMRYTFGNNLRDVHTV